MGGKSKIMDFVAPDGPVYQAGTLSGNPLAMSAGLSVLEQLNDNLYRRLERISSKIENGINDNIKKLGFNANVARVGSMMTLFFTEKNYVRNFKDANQCNTNIC